MYNQLTGYLGPAIMLSGIKRELSEIRHALLSLDDSKLSIDDLRAISRQLPTAEEVCCWYELHSSNLVLTVP